MASGAHGIYFDEHPNSHFTKSAQADDINSIRKASMKSMLSGLSGGWQDAAEHGTDHCDFKMPTRQTIFEGESVPLICGSTHKGHCKTGMETFWAAHNGVEDVIKKAFGDYYVSNSHQMLKVMDSDTVFVTWILQLAPGVQVNYSYVAARWWEDGNGFILMMSAAPDSNDLYINPDLPRVEMHAGTLYQPDAESPNSKHRHTCYFHGKTPMPPPAVAALLDYGHRGMEAVANGYVYPPPKDAKAKAKKDDKKKIAITSTE